MSDTAKLNIDVEAAQAKAKAQSEQDKVYRDARWRQLFQACLEGAAVGLVDEVEDPEGEEPEEGEEPIPSIEEQLRERAALTASGAAMLADFALSIEIQRGLT